VLNWSATVGALPSSCSNLVAWTPAACVRIYRIGIAADYRDIALLHPLIWILHRLAAGGTLPLAIITSAKSARQAARNELNAAR
jgi:hypothetical protein